MIILAPSVRNYFIASADWVGLYLFTQLLNYQSVGGAASPLGALAIPHVDYIYVKSPMKPAFGG